jgi:hypothetical protein
MNKMVLIEKEKEILIHALRNQINLLNKSDLETAKILLMRLMV